MVIKNYLVFETESGNKYIYDNSTSYVIPYNELLVFFIENSENKFEQTDLEKLHKQLNFELSYVENKYKSFKKMQDMGYFSNNNAFKEINKEKFFELIYDSPVSQLLLIVTNNCNMRCIYCVYSDMYPETIGYKDDEMSFDIAVKAIEQYMKLHQTREQKGMTKNPSINFYGGEPLLNFDLIKKVVNHCSANYTHEFDYYITTNGLLLQENLIEFLVLNDFRVTVSLDGNMENHDRNRVTCDGKGTHSKVLKNVKKYFQIKEVMPNSKSIMSFNVCYDSYTAPEAILEFFEEDELLRDKDVPIFFSEIIPFGTEYYNYCEKLHEDGVISNPSNTWKKGFKQIQDDFFEDMKEGNKISSYRRSLFTNYFFHGNRNIGRRGPLNNSCIPGGKIAVNAEGEFFLCERVCEKFPIGNIKNGLTWEKIKAMLEQFMKILNEHCSKCNVSKMCQLCFMHLAFEAQSELIFNEEFCNKTKEYVPMLLSRIYGAKEKNNLAFREETLHGKDF